MEDELYQFLACEYYATGEGHTVSLLITRAYPRADDYETGTDKPQIAPGRTAEVRAKREFTEQFGSWYAQGVENLERQEFLERFGSYLPWYVKNILTSAEIPGNFNYITQLHINYS